MTDPAIFVCTKENPWSPERDKGKRVQHSDADEVGEQEDGWPGGDIVTYECPNCKHTLITVGDLRRAREAHALITEALAQSQDKP